MLWESCQECVWRPLLKTRLECDFWTQLFSFPQKQKATSGQIHSSLAFIFVFIYLFLYSLPPLWLSENTCLWAGGMVQTSLSKWGEWFPVSATRRLCTARTCPLSISSELLGYFWTIYICAARRLYARLVWNGFTLDNLILLRSFLEVISSWLHIHQIFARDTSYQITAFSTHSVRLAAMRALEP